MAGRRAATGISPIFRWSGLNDIFTAGFFLAILLAVSNAAISPTFAKSDKKPATARRVLVIGDSLGGSIWIGIYQHYYGNRSVKVIRHTKISTGIVRDDFYDWNKAAKKLIQSHKADDVIMMIGGNDGQPIRVAGKRYRERVGTQLWRKTYGDRVEQLVKTFQQSGARFYWVGIPIQRSSRDDKIGKLINGIFAERCKKLGARYIDIYQMFAGPKGQYVTHLADDKGRRKLMRDRDGMHFTTPGVVWLGRVVGKIVDDGAKAAMTAARTDERVVKAGAKAKPVEATTAKHERAAKGVVTIGHTERPQ